MFFVPGASAQPKPQCYCPSYLDFYLYCEGWCTNHEGSSYSSCSYCGPYMCICVDDEIFAGIDPCTGC